MFFYLTTLGLARFLKETVPQVEHPAEEDAGIKKFVVACFLDYKMVDSKNVISQVQDLQKTGSSSRLDDEVVQDKRQRDENDLQVERQDQVEEDLPPDCKPRGYKWIFKKKMKGDGTIDKNKARHHVVIEGYSDPNWISDIKDSRSTSGYVFTLGGAAISWKSSKQTVIAKSMME
nr:zinc finger, CCHC-type [Tanacetum cinerariifolium]